MEDEESYAERQDEELQVLDSIFGEDFKDVRKDDKWKVPRSPEILLQLKPQESMSGTKEVHATLSLRVKLSKRYPDVPPELTIENAKGLSDDVVKNLTEVLKEQAVESVGEVMMLQLCQCVQETLHKYNRPTLSIYEENMRFKEEQEAKQKQRMEEIQRRKRDNQRREIEEEINRRKEEEKNLKKERKREKSDDKSERQHLDSTGNGGFDISQYPPVPVSVIEFNTKTSRQVYRGKCIGKGPSGCVVHMGIDKDTGCPLAIHEWIVSCPVHKKYHTDAEMAKVNKYLKAVKAVEQELHSLLKLEHVNLVKYLAVRHTEEENHIEVDILEEYVAGASLQAKIASNNPVPVRAVHSIAEQLLSVLDYLHVHSVVHKNLKASSVFVDWHGVVKLSDYSIGKRLADLYKESHMEQPSVTFSDDAIPSRTTKKGDILKLGMLLFSLVQGRQVKEYPPEIPSRLPAIFHDFLNKCLEVEDRLRWTATELLDHGFLKPSISSSPDSPLDCRNGQEENGVDRNSDDELDSGQYHDPTTYPIPTALQLSRLHSEFEEMQWLGEGGFGDVVKVRNKLDGRFYAIKRILLDPRRSQFNKKITREVKLLSRLNHENVVRYYNSWIETLQDQEESTSESASSLQSDSKLSDSAKVNSLGLIDDVEANLPPPVNSGASEWTSVDNFSSFHQDADEDEDEEEEDVLGCLHSYNIEMEESSEDVMFECSDPDSEDQGQDQKDANQTSSLATKETTSESSSQDPKCYLYIQMEYCERSTLREAINNPDSRLCNDKSRMWRLFREILDGLVHVHEQGMIHRDLKPQNIFLDKKNHIKIGDFGLATSHTLGMATTASMLDLASSKSEGGDSAMTGRIGTALYVAPELNKPGSRMVYNQKVDMYSVGIIFFEMCYSGLQTRMERVKVLGNMRLEEIKFPDDWDEVSMQNEDSILRWCLKHQPEKRPTAAELLKSHLVPAPALERSHVVRSVRQALMDPHSAPHRLLMQELFAVPDNRKDDVFYDIDMQKGSFSSSQHLMQENVHSQVISILKRHGAMKVSPPLLVPRKQLRSIQEAVEEEDEREATTEPEGPPVATFMDMSGTVVTLPHDLRVPFARYIVRNGIHNLKRYAIEKVFRKVKIHRSHPRELWECAFDIVSPTVCNLIPDAECISVVAEIISAFPLLLQRSYKVTVNHTILLQAIFAHSCIPADKYEAVKLVLANAKMEKASKTQLKLLDLQLSSQQVSTLCSFIDQQGPLSKIQSLLKTLVRNKQSPVSSQARQALHELEALRKNLESFGVRLPVIVHLGLVHNLNQYSGIIFQVSAEIKKKRKAVMEVLAAGGRYDSLVQQMAHLQLSHMRSIHDKETFNHIKKQQCASGVSIAIERIVSLNLSAYQTPPIRPSSTTPPLDPATSSSSHSYQDSGMHPLSTVDVWVAVMGRNQLFQERIRILRNLWEAGIHAEMTLEGAGIDADSLEILQDRAINQGISHLVILKDKDNSIKVRSYDNIQGFSKHQEKSLHAEDLVDYFLKKKKEVDDSSTSVTRHSVDHGASSINGPTSDTSASAPVTSIHHGTRQLNIEVLPPDKLAYNIKKRHEAQISTRLAQLPILHHISGKAEIYVLAVDLPSSVLKTLVLNLEIGQGEEEFNRSAANALLQLPKYKKYFRRITDVICDAKYRKEVPLIILYTYKDDNYRLLA